MLEESIVTLCKSLDRLSAALELAHKAQKYVKDDKAVPVNIREDKDVNDAPVEGAKPTATLGEVRACFNKLNAKHGRNAVMGILQAFGASRLTGISEDRFGEIIDMVARQYGAL